MTPAHAKTFLDALVSRGASPTEVADTAKHLIARNDSAAIDALVAADVEAAQIAAVAKTYIDKLDATRARNRVYQGRHRANHPRARAGPLCQSDISLTSDLCGKPATLARAGSDSKNLGREEDDVDDDARASTLNENVVKFREPQVGNRAVHLAREVKQTVIEAGKLYPDTWNDTLAVKEALEALTYAVSKGLRPKEAFDIALDAARLATARATARIKVFGFFLAPNIIPKAYSQALNAAKRTQAAAKQSELFGAISGDKDGRSGKKQSIDEWADQAKSELGQPSSQDGGNGAAPDKVAGDRRDRAPDEKLVG